jgi:N-acetylglucosamine kinase-like BadF-type ATPase
MSKHWDRLLLWSIKPVLERIRLSIMLEGEATRVRLQQWGHQIMDNVQELKDTVQETADVVGQMAGKQEEIGKDLDYAVKILESGSGGTDQQTINDALEIAKRVRDAVKVQNDALTALASKITPPVEPPTP